MPFTVDYAALATFRFELRRFLDFSEQAARRAGLEPHQHQALLVLRALENSAAPDISALSSGLRIRHHSAVELADRLEARGLVRRFPSHVDRRKVLLRLTPLGRRLLEDVSRRHIRMLRGEGKVLLRALRRAVWQARKVASQQPDRRHSIAGMQKAGPRNNRS
jgi:DNA-binding MarR family transcriptional regulator